MAILVTAQVLGMVAGRLGVPTVIGEICAGILLGPSLLNFVQPTQVFQLLAEFGIILLLFEVGLETDVIRLLHSGRRSALVAIAGFVAPFVLGYLMAAHVFHLSQIVSLFIGGTLTATSIGITVRILGDLGRQHSAEAQVVLGAAVLDDILGVVLLAVLYEFSVSGRVDIANTGKVIMFIGAFMVLAPLAAKLFTSGLHHIPEFCEMPNAMPVMLVSLVLFFSWLAHIMGAPELLGGFAAGLALSRRFFLPFGLALKRQECFGAGISDRLRPIIGLFTPVFFVVVGLNLNLQAVDWDSPFIWAFSTSVFVVALVAKMVGALLLRVDWPTRWAIGLAMVPRGEVGLIFAELGRSADVFDNEVYAGVVLVIALTTLLAPLMMKAFYSRFGHLLPGGDIGGKNGQD
jgi:Kef-type K+ transport system membrane component KefB